MVASFHAISQSSSGGAGYDGSYYTADATPDYYGNGGTRPGQWFGTGAEALGISGNVDPKHFRAVLQGYHPHSQQPLTRSVKTTLARDAIKTKNRCACVDITLSPPSSYAAFWAAADRPLRNRLQSAFDRAARDTFASIEKQLPLARRGRGGAIQEHAKLVVAMFDHPTNRNFDPNPHRHCVIANVCQRADGTWAAVNTKMLCDWTRTIGPIFRAKLALELRRDLGLKLVQPIRDNGKPESWWEIAGVPETLSAHWSSRREELLKAIEGRNGNTDATAQARAKANLATRRSKEALPPHAELFRTWRNEAEKHGFRPEHLVRTAPHTVTNITRTYADAWNAGLTQLTQQQSHFSYRELVQHVAENLQTTGIDSAELLTWVRSDLTNSPDIVLLDPTKGKERYTTQELWDTEQAMLNSSSALQDRRGPIVSNKIIDKQFRKRPTISDEQKAAVRHLLRQPGSLRILTGIAGAGKTFALDTVREALQESGYKVIGGAISGAAKEELAATAKLESRTVASYLYHLEKPTTKRIKDRVRHDARQLLRAIQGKKTYRQQSLKLDAKTVLVLDEAGMIDTRTMARLLKQAQSAGSTVILTGDDRQLQPILAGGPLRHLKQKHGHFHMEQNRRQASAMDRQSALEVRTGQPETALSTYLKLGRLTVAADRLKAVDDLIATWAQAGGTKQPRDHLIFTSTRQDANAINRLCQKARLESLPVPPTSAVSTPTGDFYVGDRILFHEPVRRMGIENGFRGTVLRVDPVRGKLMVRLDQPRARHAGKKVYSNTVTIAIKDFSKDGITLGYAATTHKMQGQTCEHAYVLFGGKMTNREVTYVQMTRGRKSTHLFVDEMHAGDQLEEITKAVLNSRRKDLAHDIRQQPPDPFELTQELEHESGPPPPYEIPQDERDT